MSFFDSSPVAGAAPDDEYNLQDHSDLYILDFGKFVLDCDGEIHLRVVNQIKSSTTAAINL